MGYSIKPGRGPSAFGAVGNVIGAVFGVFWIIMAVAITKDAPFPLVRVVFPLFGVCFVGMAIAGAIYNSRNATSNNRFSAFDIVPSHEEPDPLDRDSAAPSSSTPSSFCRRCGAGLQEGDNFCSRCGESTKIG